ncbi:MAG TPA: AmmeMemoRadiSam system protein B [Candidatus Polarisedimenticolaceae bacterium]|nr:AmmeMemoRadiSam system protein B [Candidatus Polarisedimenticolaceae bacterium]
MPILMLDGLVLLTACALLAQATVYPAGDRAPTLEETRSTMGIASTDALRGQRDAIGFSSTAEQMKTTWDLSAEGPAPDKLGPAPPAGVLGALSPHDDYLYAGRVYRAVLPLVTAKTVVVIGVFHQYRKYRVRDRIVFDTYPAWRTPDGPVPVSAMREDLRAAMKDDAIQDAASHDMEHSIEAEVYWLRHADPAVEIVPILAPATRFERLQEIAAKLGGAIAASMKKRGLTLGKDVAIVISADAVHYGLDFRQVPFGDGGIDAYTKATARDRDLLQGPIAGPLEVAKIKTLYGTFVDPADPDTYRVSWCGRFSVPFGMLVMKETAKAMGLGTPVGMPLAYATSVGAPELRVRDTGMGETAPANLYHFVGYPAAVWVAP